MIAYKLQLKIIVMPLIIMIIMISGAGPRTRPARKKAGMENWFSSETQQAAAGWERGLLGRAVQRVLVRRARVCRGLQAQFLCGSGLKSQAALERAKPC